MVISDTDACRCRSESVVSLSYRSYFGCNSTFALSGISLSQLILYSTNVLALCFPLFTSALAFSFVARDTLTTLVVDVTNAPARQALKFPMPKSLWCQIYSTEMK